MFNFYATDLKRDKVMVGIERHTFSHELVKAEAGKPLPEKHLDDRITYTSRHDFKREFTGNIMRAVIMDFEKAVDGDARPQYHHMIQTNGYQASEVILGAGWSYSADVWSLDVVVCVSCFLLINMNDPRLMSSFRLRKCSVESTPLKI